MWLVSTFCLPRTQVVTLYGKNLEEFVWPVVRNVSYPMNPYAFRTCAVSASYHVLKDLKLNIVEFSVFRYTISWYITERDQEIPSFSFTAIWRKYFWST